MNANQIKSSVDYDAYLSFGLSYNCNLNCHYCCNSQLLNGHDATTEINVPLFLKTIEQTGLTFCVAFCGFGETFLIKNLTAACRAIAQDHYVSLISNLTLPAVKEFGLKLDPGRVLEIVASAHLKELENKKLFDAYVDNFLFLKRRGFNISAVAVAHPSLLTEVEKYKNIFRDKGIELKFRNFGGEYNGRLYPQAYTRRELKTFNLSLKPHYRYSRICNAGYNIALILQHGEVASCFHPRNHLGNIYTKINFNENLVVCPFKFCDCVANDQTSYLLNKVLPNIGWKKISFIYYIFIKERFYSLIDRFLGKIGMTLGRYFPESYRRLGATRSKTQKFLLTRKNYRD